MLPQPVIELLTLVLVTMGGTGLIKKLADKLGTKLGGPAAVILSWLVAIVVTVLSVMNGWATLPDITCAGAELVGTCLISLLQAALAVATFANLVYVYVYERVFNPPVVEPVVVVPAESAAAKEVVAAVKAKATA